MSIKRDKSYWNIMSYEQKKEGDDEKFNSGSGLNRVVFAGGF